MKNLKNEYQKEVQTQAPDLWARINAGIDEYEASKGSSTEKPVPTNISNEVERNNRETPVNNDAEHAANNDNSHTVRNYGETSANNDAERDVKNDIHTVKTAENPSANNNDNKSVRFERSRFTRNLTHIAAAVLCIFVVMAGFKIFNKSPKSIMNSASKNEYHEEALTEAVQEAPEDADFAPNADTSSYDEAECFEETICEETVCEEVEENEEEAVDDFSAKTDIQSQNEGSPNLSYSGAEPSKKTGLSSNRSDNSSPNTTLSLSEDISLIDMSDPNVKLFTETLDINEIQAQKLLTGLYSLGLTHISDPKIVASSSINYMIKPKTSSFTEDTVPFIFTDDNANEQYIVFYQKTDEDLNIEAVKRNDDTEDFLYLRPSKTE
ncbi:MAG: hypothetical protein K6F84_06085 [Lachnospiraceae bacterium]|nr:hypothetical protein [Lachnospiraceae bacterium]